MTPGARSSAWVRLLVLRATLAGLVLGPAVAAAEQPMAGTRCRVLEYTFWQGVQLSAEDRVETFEDVVFLCDDGQRIAADSAVIRSPRGRSELLGNVVMQEGAETMRAGAADYYLEDGRLIARGGVTLVDGTTGRQVLGEAMSRLPPTDFRPLEEVTVTGRPAMATVPSSTPGAEGTVVRALRIVFEGEEDFRAYSEVEVDRDSLHVTSDSMSYAEGAGIIRFGGNARMVGTSGEFRGEEITLGLRDEEVESVRVVGQGVLLGEDLDLRAEEIRVTLREGEVEGLVAVRGEAELEEFVVPPPYAVTAGFFLTGDSIDVLSPGGVLTLVDAVGSAWGQTRDELEAIPDPGIPPSERLREGVLTRDRLDQDWIEGGAIRIEFEDGEIRPGSDRPERIARRLTATEGGRALYRTPPEGEAVDDRSVWPIEYVVAATIVLHLQDTGEVDRIEAVGGMSGIHLDPNPAPTPAPTPSPNPSPNPPTPAVAPAPDAGDAR